eukprot:GHVS01035629.1.p1 GENE.GHVS01035629.1~~GHVS01035629.1.p1  ORF type:complete len:759 (-),score=93.38 GHVS01035629.1:172-2448(-)
MEEHLGKSKANEEELKSNATDLERELKELQMRYDEETGRLQGRIADVEKAQMKLIEKAFVSAEPGAAVQTRKKSNKNELTLSTVPTSEAQAPISNGNVSDQSTTETYQTRYDRLRTVTASLRAQLNSSLPPSDSQRKRRRIEQIGSNGSVSTTEVGSSASMSMTGMAASAILSKRLEQEGIIMTPAVSVENQESKNYRDIQSLAEENKRKQLQTSLDECTASMDKLDRVFRILMTKFTGEVKQRKQSQTSLEECTASRDNLKEKLNELQTRYDTERTQAQKSLQEYAEADWEKKFNKLQRKHSLKEEERKGLEKSLTRYKEKAKKMAMDLVKATAIKDNMEKEKDELQSQCQSQAGTIKKMEEHLGKSKANEEELKSNATDLERELKELQMRYDEEKGGLQGQIADLEKAQLTLLGKVFQPTEAAVAVQEVTSASLLAKRPKRMKEMESALKGVLNGGINDEQTQVVQHLLAKEFATGIASLTNTLVGGTNISCHPVGSTAEGVGLFIKGHSDIDVACQVDNPEDTAGKIAIRTSVNAKYLTTAMNRKISIKYFGNKGTHKIPAVTCTFTATIYGEDAMLDVVYFKAEATTGTRYLGLEQAKIMKVMFAKYTFARPIVLFLKTASAFVASIFPEANKKSSSYASSILFKAWLDTLLEHENAPDKLLRKFANWVSNLAVRLEVRCDVDDYYNITCTSNGVPSSTPGITIFEPLYQKDDANHICNISEKTVELGSSAGQLAQHALYTYQGMLCLIGDSVG